MSNLAVLPIIIPLFAGIMAAFFNRKLTIARSLSKLLIVSNLIVVFYIAYLVFETGNIVLETGSWPAPYGIVFVADPLSILLVFTTNILSVASILIALKNVLEHKITHNY